MELVEVRRVNNQLFLEKQPPEYWQILIHQVRHYEKLTVVTAMELDCWRISIWIS
jgi:hypothetical protein